MWKLYDQFGKNGMTVSTQYLKHDDYWDQDERIKGYWHGKNCTELEVIEGGEVGDEDFERLKRAKQKDGSKIIAKENTTRTIEVVKDGVRKKVEVPNRKQFADLVCSAPKTFSMQAVNGGDYRVFEWHRNALAVSMEAMQEISCHQAHDGEKHVETVGNWISCVYEHSTNRLEESALHSHVIVFNMVKGKNGKWYAHEYAEFVNQFKKFNAVYRHELARQAREAGLNIVTGEHGEPQIAELLPYAKKHSTRSEHLKMLIESVEEFAGIKISGKERSDLSRASRGIDLEKFRSRFKEFKLDVTHKINPETALRDRKRLMDTYVALVNDCSEHKLKRISKSDLAALREEQISPEERKIHEALKVQKAPNDSGLSSLEESIEFSLKHLFERQSVIKIYDLHAAVLQHSLGNKNVTMNQIESAVAADPRLVFARDEVTPLSHWLKEVESVKAIQAGLKHGVRIPSVGISEKLSKDQKKAVEFLLSSQSQFTALTGRAGCGKTFVLSDVIKANLELGYRVVVLAPQHGAKDVVIKGAEDLPDGAAKEALSRANTTQMFLVDKRLQDQLRAYDLVVVDEASGLDMDAGHELQQLALKNRWRLLESGDYLQNPSVRAGDHFRVLLQKTKVPTAELRDMRRQSEKALEGRYRKACKLMAAERTTEGLAELDKADRIHVLRGRERIEVFAKNIVDSRDNGEKTIAVCATHAENSEINAEVRRIKHERGQLHDERVLDTFFSLNWTEAERSEVRNFSKGMVVELTTGKNQGKSFTVDYVDYQQNRAVAVGSNGVRMVVDSRSAPFINVCAKRQLPVAIGDELLIRGSAGKHKNGTVVQVAGYDQSGNPVDQHGKSITSRNIAHAYSRTDCRVQGDTASKVLVGVSRNTVRWMTKNKMYVAATRGKIDIDIYVENRQDLALIQERSSDRKSSIELIKFCIDNVIKKQIQEKQTLRAPEHWWKLDSDSDMGIRI
jgi:conjugative relaxase-like TrwC/TraI family protein